MNILKEVRQFLGLSQAELAKGLGISRSQVGNIEQGKRNITDRIKKDLITFFNVNPIWLETGEGDIIKDKYKAYNLTEKQKEFLELFNQLDTDEENLIVEMMKKIQSK